MSHEELIVSHMLNLGITRAEAEQLIEDDKRIDRGEKLFELPDELKAGAKKARQADRKPTTYDFSKRERKPNDSKRAIIAALAETARELADSGEVDITNIEREMLFVANGVKYKIVLSAPRS
jgi:hypothetical protein